MADSSIQLSQVDDRYILLEINQFGSSVNLLSTPFWQEFDSCLDEINNEPDVAGLIIQSSKTGIFIAGADLKEFKDADPENPEPTRNYLQIGQKVLDKLESVRFPTVCYVDGICLGGGLEVALACDFRLAGTHAKCQFGFPEIHLGLIPGWGGTQRLPRLIGLAPAAEWIIHGQRYSAEKAKEFNLVSDIVSSEMALAKAVELMTASQWSSSWQLEREKKFNPHWEAFFDNENGFTEFSQMILPDRVQTEDSEVTAIDVALEVMYLGCFRNLEEGLSIETEGFLLLAGSEENKQKVTQFFEERNKSST